MRPAYFLIVRLYKNSTRKKKRKFNPVITQECRHKKTEQAEASDMYKK